MDNKVGIVSLVLTSITIVVVITFSFLSLLAVVGFSILALPPVHDKLWEKHPDTRIYQYVTSNGPSVMVDNRGKAMDNVRIEIRLLDGSIVDMSVSENTTVELKRGGPEESYAIFEIDELWPNVCQFIDITTSSPIKTAAEVKGDSLLKGTIEEIPVTLIGKP